MSEKQSKHGTAIDDTLCAFREDQLRIEGDERFKEAMIVAGYKPYIHTTPCTENPRMLHPQVSLQSGNGSGNVGFRHMPHLFGS